MCRFKVKLSIAFFFFFKPFGLGEMEIFCLLKTEYLQHVLGFILGGTESSSGT